MSLDDTKIAEPMQQKSANFGPASAIVVVLVTYILSQVFAVAIIGAGAKLFGYNAEEALKSLESSTLVQFIYIAIVEVLILAGLFWFMRLRRISLRDIGLGRKPSLKDLAPAGQVFVVYFIALIAITSLVESLLPSVDVDQKQQLGFESVNTDVQLALVFVSLVILPAIVEEIMVRGFLYSGLRKKLTKIMAAIAASLVFGVAHLQLGSGANPLWIAAIDTALLSLFLIYLRERTGALWAGMLVHGLKNGLAFLALFVVDI